VIDPFIRKARPEDFRIVCDLFLAAMGNIRLGWEKGDNGPAAEIVKSLYFLPFSRFSMEYVSVIEDEGEIKGMISLIPYTKLFWSDIRTGMGLFMKAGFFRTIGLGKYISLKEAGKGEMFISGLGVVQESRGKGYGSRLLDFSITETIRLGLNKTSLIVEQENSIAYSLYLKKKFIVVSSQEMDKEQKFHRMVKKV